MSRGPDRAVNVTDGALLKPMLLLTLPIIATNLYPLVTWYDLARPASGSASRSRTSPSSWSPSRGSSGQLDGGHRGRGPGNDGYEGAIDAGPDAEVTGEDD